MGPRNKICSDKSVLRTSSPVQVTSGPAGWHIDCSGAGGKQLLEPVVSCVSQKAFKGIQSQLNKQKKIWCQKSRVSIGKWSG